ncbi:hypothetical protein RFI_01268, partial [Reticulomyxa filosa]
PTQSPTTAPSDNSNQNSNIIKGLKNLYLWIAIGAVGGILLLLIILIFIICHKKRGEKNAQHVIDVPDDKKKSTTTPRFGTTTSPNSDSAGEKDVEKHIQVSAEMTIPKNLVPVGTDMTTDGEAQEKTNDKVADPVISENAYTDANITQTQKNLDEDFDPTKQREKEVVKPELPPLSIVTPVNISEREESNSNEKQTNLELQAADQQHISALDV